MVRFLKIYITFLALCVVSQSCIKEARESVFNEQEIVIDKYVTSLLSKDPDLKVFYNGGSVRIVMSEGEGLEVSSRGSVTIDYCIYDFKSGNIGTSNMVATNSSVYAAEAKWNLSDKSIFTPLTVKLNDSSVIQGLRDGLEGVREGEECLILFSGKYGFGKNAPGTINANASLAFKVNVLSIEN